MTMPMRSPCDRVLVPDVITAVFQSLEAMVSTPEVSVALTSKVPSGCGLVLVGAAVKSCRPMSRVEAEPVAAKVTVPVLKVMEPPPAALNTLPVPRPSMNRCPMTAAFSDVASSVLGVPAVASSSGPLGKSSPISDETWVIALRPLVFQ